jgi:hypothetical protein
MRQRRSDWYRAGHGTILVDGVDWVPCGAPMIKYARAAAGYPGAPCSGSPGPR